MSRFLVIDKILTDYKSNTAIADLSIVANNKTYIASNEGFEENPEITNNNSDPKRFDGVQYMLTGINADQAKELLYGTAYVEFWVEAMHCGKPTLNRRVYPLEPFIDALNDAGVKRQMNFGGLGGKFAHIYSNVCMKVC